MQDKRTTPGADGVRLPGEKDFNAEIAGDAEGWMNPLFIVEVKLLAGRGLFK